MAKNVITSKLYYYRFTDSLKPINIVYLLQDNIIITVNLTYKKINITFNNTNLPKDSRPITSMDFENLLNEFNMI